ncbi:MAG: hypothetical protein WCF23_02935, partial [Candidatus Nitrosopolaris sp.]
CNSSDPIIGYGKASSIAHKALKEKMTLRDASISSGYTSAEDFDRIVVPTNMVGNPDKGLEYLITLSNM